MVLVFIVLVFSGFVWFLFFRNLLLDPGKCLNGFADSGWFLFPLKADQFRGALAAGELGLDLLDERPGDVGEGERDKVRRHRAACAAKRGVPSPPTAR